MTKNSLMSASSCSGVLGTRILLLQKSHVTRGVKRETRGTIIPRLHVKRETPTLSRSRRSHCSSITTPFANKRQAEKMRHTRYGSCTPRSELERRHHYVGKSSRVTCNPVRFSMTAASSKRPSLRTANVLSQHAGKRHNGGRDPTPAISPPPKKNQQRRRVGGRGPRDSEKPVEAQRTLFSPRER